MFGLGGLLTTLRARVRCRDVVVAALYPDARKAPPPYSGAELRRFGLVIDDAPKEVRKCHETVGT
jgi:hypothetical protein